MAVKPPKGFVAFGSKKGGYRKRAPNGGYVYWYPDGKGGKGRITNKKHKSDVGARDAIMTMIEAALPPDKRAMLFKLSELLDGEDQPDTTNESSEDAAAATAGADTGRQQVEGATAGAAAEAAQGYVPPDELTDLYGEASDARRRAQTEVERHRLEQERQRMQAVAEALAELAPGISDDEVAKIKAAVGRKFGQMEGGPNSPEAIMSAIRDVTRDPELYGVLPEQRKALEDVDRLMRSLDTGELPERGFEVTDTDSPVGKALSVAVAGVKLVTSAVQLFRATVGTKNEAAATAFLRNTIGAAYTMGALGAAAVLGQIAPQHPIARHARDYGTFIDTHSGDVGAIERAHRRIDYVVRTMGDQDMDQSLKIISDNLMRLGVMKPPPRIPQNVLDNSLGMHRALQGLQDAIQGREVGVSERESNLRRAFADLVGDVLWKARATKYCRREPTGNPKRPWRYFYGDECGTAAARSLKQGDIVRVGTARVRVESVAADGTVTLAPVDEDMDSDIFGRDPLVFKATEWSNLMRKHFGSAFQRSADRRARQAVNAVLRYVPASMLADLEGDTEAERLESLKVRAPEIYQRLQLAFRRSGVDLVTARTYIADALMEQGWDGEARAALMGNLLDERNAWLAKNYRRVIRATNNARTGDQVTAREVQAAVDILRPGGPASNIDKLTAAAKPDVEELRKALDALRGSPDVDAAKAILEKMLGTPSLAQMMAVTQALPETATETSDTVRDMTAELQAATPRAPSREGAATTVYVAGKNGAPVALPGRYVLMEADEAIPSHNAETFGQRSDYPEGLQERAYHRDRNEQLKVIRNAQRMEPGFVINTNPDALNGPPIANADGHVLGGNSRTMSIQRIYKFHPDKAEEYRQYLRDNAYQAGFTEADFEGMDSPILMRVVDTAGQDQNLLVRQMNESFIQSMDPRTMQVAMGRRLTRANLDSLAGTMESDETLRAYLDSSRAKDFIATLSSAGIIDDRNRSQYVRKGGKLNEDGKQLVERILVGHVIPDPDVLSGARARTIGAVARSVPYLVQAEGASKRYDIRQNLRDALDGHIRMHDLGFQPARGAGKRERDEAVRNTRAQMTDMFTGDHPVLADERTGMLFDVLVQHDGPIKMAKIFKEYANQASANPEGQQTLMGPPPTATDILRQSIRAVEQREQSEATPAGGLFRAARERLDLLKSDAKKTPAEPHERRKGSSKNRRGSAATGSGSIELSESTIETLKNKVKEHNEKSSKKVTLGQLKAVYRRGAGAFSTSHHPRANRHSWSMGRVNSFLRRVKGGKGHSQDDDLIRKAGGPYYGPRGGKWADPQHTISWKDRDAPAAENPVVTKLYGGIPSAGGFSSHREFGLGLGNTFEAAHCILGSLGRNLGGGTDDKAIDHMLRSEAGHLDEEMSIIRSNLREYSRQIYRDQMTMADIHEYKPEYKERVRENTRRQVEDIRTSGARLSALTDSLIEDFIAAVPKEFSTKKVTSWLSFSAATYSFIRHLSRAAVESVARWPAEVGDPFSDEKVRKAFSLMEKHHKALLGRDYADQLSELLKAQKRYKVPESARNNARKVLEWKRQHGSEVKGMTAVGWARARQLASQTHVGLDTVRRMAAFNRHRKNAEVAPEHKSTPWKDAGRVAWLGWGGSSGVDWARRITGAADED